jgi:hypothetical protein
MERSKWLLGGAPKGAARALAALLACALACVGVSACGGSGGRSSTRASTQALVSSGASAAGASSRTVAVRPVDSDRDEDGGGPTDDTSHTREEGYGHAGSTADARAIAALLKRYYAVALAGDGARGCALLYSTLAEGVPEDYGGGGGPTPTGGNRTCPEVLHEEFAREHARLALLTPRLTVRRVRVFERHGVAFLRFGPGLPEREIQLMREGSVWRMGVLLDGELP